MIEQLSRKSELASTATIEAIHRKLEDVKSKSMVANVKNCRPPREPDESTLERVQEQIKELWPELAEDYSPLAMELTSDRADEFVATVGAMPAYSAMTRCASCSKWQRKESHDVERIEAKLQRLLRTCENVVLAANLPIVAPAEIVKRYEKLIALEGGLGPVGRIAEMVGSRASANCNMSS